MDHLREPLAVLIDKSPVQAASRTATYIREAYAERVAVSRPRMLIGTRERHAAELDTRRLGADPSAPSEETT